MSFGTAGQFCLYVVLTVYLADIRDFVAASGSSTAPPHATPGASYTSVKGSVCIESSRPVYLQLHPSQRIPGSRPCRTRSSRPSIPPPPTKPPHPGQSHHRQFKLVALPPTTSPYRASPVWILLRPFPSSPPHPTALRRQPRPQEHRRARSRSDACVPSLGCCRTMPTALRR